MLSPGSRSTPVALACAAEKRFAVHVLVDERVAGFFALGAARATGRPSLLVCTSGSAPAHYFPALIEAARAGVPLVVLTADRPPELHHRDAAQTIDQAKLFGGHARRYVELGLPDDDPRALAGLAGTAALAVATSLAPSAGPVHLNAWFRKPLEPVAPGPEDAAYREAVAALCARPPVRRFGPRRGPAPEAIAELAARCRALPRGLIVCGPAAPAQRALRQPLALLARATGFPVLAEATSQLRFDGTTHGAGAARCDLFDPVLRAPGFLARHRPELVLQVGGPPASKGFEELVSGPGAPERWVVTDHGWNDPFNTAAGIVAAAPVATIEALTSALSGQFAPAPGWADAWAAAGAVARDALGRLLEAHAGAEARALRAAVARSRGGLLMLGNSLPVREADLFCEGALTDAGVLSQRGANGIDGLIAGAAGAAAATGIPTTLVLGDVSLAHDAGGLAACALAGAPLEVVVLDNGGGRLFELLPLAAHGDLRATFERLFLTRPALDVEALARAFGVSYARAESAADLERLPPAAASAPRLVHVVVDGAGTRSFHHALLASVADALA